MPANNAADFSEYLPDYVAECDEHLTAARRILLDVEPDPARLSRDDLDALFRQFHSVKGLSGMVGVREAERLAHQMEAYLGTVRRGELAATAAGVSALIDGVRTLERAVGARRDGVPPPDVGPTVARLTALRPEYPAAPAPPPDLDPPASLSAEKLARVAAAVRTGSRAWRVTFASGPEPSARGVTVDAVRKGLLVAGEIVHAEPRVTPGGVAFAFVVVTPPDAPAPAGEWLGVEPFDAGPDGPAPSAGSLTPSNLVRVDLGRLDDLMRAVGELVITRARLDNGLGRVAATLPARERRDLEETAQALERQLRDLRDGVMRVRLVPVRDVFARMRFVVRDLARGAGKDVELVSAGEATEVDKFVVERLADPLLHLVRNAVGHGLESPAERTAAGKPPRGRIDLRAAATGGAIEIEVEDDGRGIDPERVFARARAAALVAPDVPTDPASVLDVICTPGFSTRETADTTSGRGVGMDVVRRAVEALGGSLALATAPGTGARFTARLPVTLAIADAVIVAVGGQTYAVPQSAVREVVQVEPGEATVLENNELLRHRGGVVPLVRLTDLFGAPRPAGGFPALIVGEGGRAVALAADRVLGLREVVVRPLADSLVQSPGLAGATELGDGRAVLILDPAGLARAARRPRA